MYIVGVVFEALFITIIKDTHRVLPVQAMLCNPLSIYNGC